MQSLKTPEGRRSLGKDMLGIANEIVGNVGTKIDIDFLHYGKGELAFFCLARKKPEHDEIVDVWTKWIKAYCVFKKQHTPEAAIIMDDPDLVVRWLKEPSIDDVDEGHPLVRVRSYLAITRLDFRQLGHIGIYSSPDSL